MTSIRASDPRPPQRPPLWTALAAAVLVLLDRNAASGRTDPETIPVKQGAAVPHEGRDATTAKGDNRGRNAASPSEIPAKGWKDILWRMYQNLPEHRVLAMAAGVTFYVLLAIFPAFAALVSVYGFFGDPSTIRQHLNDLSNVLPGGATEVIGDQLQRLTSQPASKLGFALFFGLAVSLWSANAGMKALFDALNVVYGEKENRSFIKLNVISLAFTIGALLFMVLALTAITVLPVILNDLGLATATEWLIELGKWPLLLTGVALGIALVYRYGPSREKPRWRWVTWGSVGAAIAWLTMSLLFSWYSANFGSYDKTYGSLGAAIGFMTWMWLSSTVILVGAELDAEMEHQTERDTTIGPGMASSYAAGAIEHSVNLGTSLRCGSPQL
jgi:membrane protein